MMSLSCQGLYLGGGLDTGWHVYAPVISYLHICSGVLKLILHIKNIKGCGVGVRSNDPDIYRGDVRSIRFIGCYVVGLYGVVVVVAK